jgi:hypothetical protein
MRTFLKNSAIVLALVGTTLALAPMAAAGGLVIGINNSGRGDHPGTAISVGVSGVAFGYRDGYWDTGHRWHRWSNNREYRNYRKHHAGNYRDFNHDHDGGDGWRGGDTRGMRGDRHHDAYRR